MEPTNIIFSDSNEYFQNAAILQSSIGFINPLDIDIYVKKSFTYTQNTITVSGGYIQPFNGNHRIDDPFVCYKIQLVDNRPLLTTTGSIMFDLEKKMFFSGNTVKNLIQGMPLISILIITLITLILPKSIANIFRYISIIGVVVTMCFYAGKIIKILYHTIKDKGVDYNGIIVHYQNTADIQTINNDYITILKQLQEMKIQSVVLSEGIFYFKQILRKSTFREAVKSTFMSRISDDTLIQKTIQDTIAFLFTTSFIGQYISAPSGGPTS